MSNYRNAFLMALAGNLLLAGILSAIWWHSGSTAEMPAAPAASMPGPGSADVVLSAMAADPALAPIPLSSPRIQGAALSFGKVTRKPVHDEIRTTGNVVVDEGRLSYVQLRFSGWIRKVFIGATFQYIQEGSPLFTIYSPDVTATEREYLVALQNQERLLDSTVPGVTAGAEALPTAALDRLRQLGVPASEIERLQNSAQAQEEIAIDSPVSGHVIEREALPNKYVEPNTRLYTIADLTTVWVVAQVLQDDIGRIRKGDTGVITVDAQPGKSFTGQVDLIYPDVDLTTRTTRVRLILPNPNLTLTPGMFANVTFHTSLGEQLTIPAGGLLQTGTHSIVFVDDGSGYLQPREIELGARAGDDFVVTKGLREGERIVTSANFLIDSESQLQAALRSFTPPGGETAAPSAAAGAAQAKLEFSTQPDPPRKGANALRVRLTDAAGSPITGADVSAAFLMPAMPAMNMPEMRAESRLREAGKGDYQATGSLESGGTWQVTITARRGGQVIAQREMSINVAGGM